MPFTRPAVGDDPPRNQCGRFLRAKLLRMLANRLSTQNVSSRSFCMVGYRLAIRSPTMRLWRAACAKSTPTDA
jgi:hypothetical protein